MAANIASDNTPAIEFDDVVAGYKDFMILNNLSFRVKPGTITLLIGPNGAGKSTVLKTLFGLLKPRQGRITLGGVDITGADPKTLLARGIAFVPQGRNRLSFVVAKAAPGVTPEAVLETAWAVVEEGGVLAVMGCWRSWAGGGMGGGGGGGWPPGCSPS
jgi:ABC-type bacteriocin/lantibiotic exporter with double-glycine peptidase domain